MLPDTHPAPSQLVPAVCHAVAVPREQRWQGASPPPRAKHPPDRAGQHPAEGPRGGSSPGLGTRGDRATSRWQWLLMPQDRARLPRLGQGLLSRRVPVHAALTRPLVFDEEELQPLLEGVFIHVELDLHPAGRAPRGAPVSGAAGQARSPPGATLSPHPSWGTPPASHSDPGLPAVPAAPNQQPGAPVTTKAADVTPGPALLWAQGWAFLHTQQLTADSQSSPFTRTSQRPKPPTKAAALEQPLPVLSAPAEQELEKGSVPGVPSMPWLCPGRRNTQHRSR